MANSNGKCYTGFFSLVKGNEKDVRTGIFRKVLVEFSTGAPEELYLPINHDNEAEFVDRTPYRFVRTTLKPHPEMYNLYPNNGKTEHKITVELSIACLLVSASRNKDNWIASQQIQGPCKLFASRTDDRCAWTIRSHVSKEVVMFRTKVELKGGKMGVATRGGYVTNHDIAENKNFIAAVDVAEFGLCEISSIDARLPELKQNEIGTWESTKFSDGKPWVAERGGYLYVRMTGNNHSPCV